MPAGARRTGKGGRATGNGGRATGNGWPLGRGIGVGCIGLPRCVRRSGLLLLARFVYCGMRAVFADGWQWQSPQNVYVEKKGTFKLCRYQHRPSYIMLIESNSY